VYPAPKVGRVKLEVISDTKIRSLTEVTKEAVFTKVSAPALWLPRANVSMTEAVTMPDHSYNANSTSVLEAPALVAVTVVLVVVGIDAALAM
jgi:hypothetical protein